MTSIAPHITAFLRERLPLQRGASHHTCESYAYTFQLLFGKRSTNPIWRLTPVFGQLGSCNGKTKLVVVDNGAAGRKSDDWSMNLKRAAREGRSSAEAGVWRWARCSDICARGVRQLKLRVADLDWWRSVSPRDLKRCPSLQRPTWRSCWPGDAGSE